MPFTIPLWFRRMAPGTLAGLLLSSFLIAQAAAPLDPGAACRIVQKTMAGRLGVPEGGPPEAGWFCEFGESQDAALHVIALKASRPLPSGRVVGWYAVARASGAVYEWNATTRRLGRPLTPGGAASKP